MYDYPQAMWIVAHTLTQSAALSPFKWVNVCVCLWDQYRRCLSSLRSQLILRAYDFCSILWVLYAVAKKKAPAISRQSTGNITSMCVCVCFRERVRTCWACVADANARAHSYSWHARAKRARLHIGSFYYALRTNCCNASYTHLYAFSFIRVILRWIVASKNTMCAFL